MYSQIAKEDFDTKARGLLGDDNVHLHNEFLFAILVKCQTGLQPTRGKSLDSAFDWVVNPKPGRFSICGCE